MAKKDIWNPNLLQNDTEESLSSKEKIISSFDEFKIFRDSSWKLKYRSYLRWNLICHIIHQIFHTVFWLYFIEDEELMDGDELINLKKGVDQCAWPRKDAETTSSTHPVGWAKHQLFRFWGRHKSSPAQPAASQ